MERIALDLDGPEPVALVNGERLTASVLGRLADAAVSALHGEAVRRREYEGREDAERMFRRLWGSTTVPMDYRGRPILAALYTGGGEMWPIGYDPATGASVHLWFCSIPVSPWGPLWMRSSRRSSTAHRWMGGSTWACGKPIMHEWNRRHAGTEAGYESAPASRCKRCAR